MPLNSAIRSTARPARSPGAAAGPRRWLLARAPAGPHTAPGGQGPLLTGHIESRFGRRKPVAGRVERLPGPLHLRLGRGQNILGRSQLNRAPEPAPAPP